MRLFDHGPGYGEYRVQRLSLVSRWPCRARVTRRANRYRQRSTTSRLSVAFRDPPRDSRIDYLTLIDRLPVPSRSGSWPLPLLLLLLPLLLGILTFLIRPPSPPKHRGTLAHVIPLHCFPLSTDRLRLPPPRHRRAVSPGFQLVCWTTLSPRGLLATDPVLVSARLRCRLTWPILRNSFLSFSKSSFRLVSTLVSTRPWWKYVARCLSQL